MKVESVVWAIAHVVRVRYLVHAFAAVLAVDGKQMVQRERKGGGRKGEMRPEYGLINYGVQTAFERERLVR